MFDLHGFEMTVFKLLIGVILIVLHLRLTGKQQTVQMTPIDFIGNFILGGIIGGVIYNHAISFTEYVIVLLVTFAIVSGLNYLTSKFMSTRSLVMGKAYTIIEGGRFAQDALNSPDQKLDPVEFLAELRGELAQAGVGELDDLFIVELDANNRLNIVDQSGNTTGMKISDPAVHEVTTVTEFKNPDMQSPSLEDFEAHDKQGDAPTL